MKLADGESINVMHKKAHGTRSKGQEQELVLMLTAMLGLLTVNNKFSAMLRINGIKKLVLVKILVVVQMAPYGLLEQKPKEVDSLSILESSELLHHGKESMVPVLISMLTDPVLLGLSINHNTFSNTMVRNGSDGPEEPLI